ncbi:ATP-binding protein [Candidatus Woesearchaeota archaeon]|nr:ATP-binding protein [Candidatus Woesearchaeota archaeon]
MMKGHCRGVASTAAHKAIKREVRACSSTGLEFSNDDLRPILGMISIQAEKFQDLEERLQERHDFFEEIVESHDLISLHQEQNDENPLLSWLLGKDNENDDDDNDDDASSAPTVANPVGLYFKVADRLYHAYEELLGLDFGEVEGKYTEEYLEMHPEAASDDGFHLFEDGLANKRTLKVLRKYEQFRAHEEYGAQPLKDRQQNAIAELEAIHAEAMRYLNFVERVESFFDKASDLASAVYQLASVEFSTMQDYHAYGNKIMKTPSLTALASALFARMDGVEEIKAGLEPDEISEHVHNNAARLLCALVDKNVYPKVVDENKIVKFAVSEVRRMHGLLLDLLPLTVEFKQQYWRYVKESVYHESDEAAVGNPEDTLRKLEEIDFGKIKYKPSKHRKSRVEERTEHANNEAYELVIAELDKLSKVSGEKRRFHAAKETVKKIIAERSMFEKNIASLSNYYRCAEGEHEQITLVPADPPHGVGPESIRGLNFDAVRKAYTMLNSQQCYQAVAKLMSSTGRISENFLLLGPPGCGKTELVRALGSDSSSIFVELRGSNLQSMWLGQTEKNPLRVFNQAEELSKQHKKRVNVFIDEAEAVLAPPPGYNEGSNKRVLSELNAILDGTSVFEGVNLIVALNSLDNVVLSNMRRFQMYVVGKLSQEDRSELLRDFVNRGLMEGKDLTPDKYRSLAGHLQGATGAIVRRPVDLITQHFWAKLVRSKQEDIADVNSELVDDQGQYDVSRATSHQRQMVKDMLKKNGYVVTYSLLQSAINRVVTNPGVQEQIRFAQDFYERAERETRQLQMSGLEVQL